MTDKELTIEIIRSDRRKKTIQGRQDGNKLKIYLPSGLTKQEEAQWIEKIKAKVDKKRFKNELNDDQYLQNRFNEFNNKYFGGHLSINSIRYVTNQNTRRGSCTPAKGTIRISHKLAGMPKWVLDYVIMHEMSHLVYPDHSKRFWKKVNEYKYTERARGFLICRGLEDTNGPDKSD
jgi:predicted metal-dependent hydrolase